MNPIEKYNLQRSIVQENLIKASAIAMLNLKSPVKDLDFAISGIAQEVAQCESADSVAELISRYLDAYFDTHIPPTELAGSAAGIWLGMNNTDV